MRLVLIAPLILLLAACGTTTVPPETAVVTAAPVILMTEPAANQDAQVRTVMRDVIGYDPLLEKIAGCESTGNPYRIRHWETDGSLVKNPSSSASGSLQVLLQYHSGWITQAGTDMYRLDEYMQFAAILRRVQGYEAWNPSKHCWGKYQHLAVPRPLPVAPTGMS